MIEEYHFGSITIDGKTYTKEVEARWTGEVLYWGKPDHNIDIDVVKRAVEQKPDTIVIGTGEMGVAKVTSEAKKYIEKNGIKLIIDVTAEAVKTFNIILEESKEEEGKQEKVIGLFHLTC